MKWRGQVNKIPSHNVSRIYISVTYRPLLVTQGQVQLTIQRQWYCTHTNRRTPATIRQSCYTQWPTNKSTNKYSTVANKQRKRQIASFIWRKNKSSTCFLSSDIHTPATNWLTINSAWHLPPWKKNKMGEQIKSILLFPQEYTYNTQIITGYTTINVTPWYIIQYIQHNMTNVTITYNCYNISNVISWTWHSLVIHRQSNKQYYSAIHISCNRINIVHTTIYTQISFHWRDSKSATTLCDPFL